MSGKTLVALVAGAVLGALIGCGYDLAIARDIEEIDSTLIGHGMLGAGAGATVSVIISFFADK